MSAHTGIAVLESRWWRNSNTSVRGLFDLVADISSDNPHAYSYEMANCEAAVKEAVPRIAADRKCKYLYVAAHGSEDGIHLHNGDRITRTEIRNMLKKIDQTEGSTLRGLYLGSCIFGTKKFAEFIFQESVAVTWIAGYKESIEWLDSSAMDLLVFNELIGRAKDSETPLQAITRASDRIKKNYGGLAKELGFGIFVRKQKTGGAKDLLE